MLYATFEVIYVTLNMVYATLKVIYATCIALILLRNLPNHGISLFVLVFSAGLAFGTFKQLTKKLFFGLVLKRNTRQFSSERASKQANSQTHTTYKDADNQTD